MKSSNKFIKSIRFAHPTAQELRSYASSYESRYAPAVRMKSVR
jgi:hypothetical protein